MVGEEPHAEIRLVLDEVVRSSNVQGASHRIGTAHHRRTRPIESKESTVKLSAGSVIGIGAALCIFGYFWRRLKPRKTMPCPTVENPTPEFTSGYKAGMDNAMDGVESPSIRSNKSYDWVCGYDSGNADGKALLSK